MTVDQIIVWLRGEAHKLYGRPWRRGDNLGMRYEQWCSQAGVLPKGVRLFMDHIASDMYLVGSDGALGCAYHWCDGNLIWDPNLDYPDVVGAERFAEIIADLTEMVVTAREIEKSLTEEV